MAPVASRSIDPAVLPKKRKFGNPAINADISTLPAKQKEGTTKKTLFFRDQFSNICLSSEDGSDQEYILVEPPQPKGPSGNRPKRYKKKRDKRLTTLDLGKKSLCARFKLFVCPYCGDSTASNAEIRSNSKVNVKDNIRRHLSVEHPSEMQTVFDNLLMEKKFDKVVPPAVTFCWDYQVRAASHLVAIILNNLKVLRIQYQHGPSFVKHDLELAEDSDLSVARSTWKLFEKKGFRLFDGIHLLTFEESVCRRNDTWTPAEVLWQNPPGETTGPGEEPPETTVCAYSFSASDRKLLSRHHNIHDPDKLMDSLAWEHIVSLCL